jgi:hypothetical protein
MASKGNRRLPSGRLHTPMKGLAGACDSIPFASRVQWAEHWAARLAAQVSQRQEGSALPAPANEILEQQLEV